MYQKHFLQLLHNKFFPQKDPLNLQLSKLVENCNSLSKEKKDEVAKALQQHGENLLAKENLIALEMFEVALEISPENGNILYRQGVAFLEHGIKHKREKAFHLAIKQLKKAVQLSEGEFSYWWHLAKALSMLGNMRNEIAYLNESKEKFVKAIKLSLHQPKEILAQLYWDYGLLWGYIATSSGEAIDVRMAIQAYKSSFSYQAKISAQFWNDFGNVHLQMGLLINNNRLYLQAVDYFKRAIAIDKQLLDAWVSMAHAYTELYINTLDDSHFNEANSSFETIVSLSSKDAEIWLEWAQLLGEAGKLNKDCKKLKASVEKCNKSYEYNSKQPLVIGQWVESLALLGAYTSNLDLIKEAESKIIQAVELYSDIPEIWYAYGLCLETFGIYYNELEYDYIAIEKFQVGLSIDRTNAELWHAIALCHTNIGKYTEDSDILKRACKFYLRAINLKPASPALIFDYAKALLKLGELTEEGEIIEQAILQFEITISGQKEVLFNHAEWLFQYGKALGILGDLSDDEGHYYLKAIETFHSIILIDPDYPDIYYYLGIYYTKLGDLRQDEKYFTAAIKYYQSALSQNNEDDLVYLEWGLSLITQALQRADSDSKRALLSEAEKKLSFAGQLGSLDSYYYLACLHSLMGHLAEAMQFLEKAREFDVLPPMSEMLEDDWLENLRATSNFFEFITQLEKGLSC